MQIFKTVIEIQEYLTNFNISLSIPFILIGHAKLNTGSILNLASSIDPSNMEVIITRVFWILIRLAPDAADPPIHPVKYERT